MTQATKSQAFTFYRIGGNPGKHGILGQVAVSDAGEVFIPAAMGGNENIVALCAMHDGVSAITNRGHVFLPISWMKNEFPANSDIFAMIEKRLSEEVNT